LPRREPSRKILIDSSEEELELIRRVQMGLIPDELHDPYPDTVEYFTSIEEKMRMFTLIRRTIHERIAHS
jgi:hypothetical protein